jgi:small subunit ribosomal protein S1
MSTDPTANANPQPAPAATQQPAPAAPQPPAGPPMPTGKRFGSKPYRPDAGGNRPPRDPKPRSDGPPAPPVREFGQGMPNKRMLDAEMEAELNAAMSGFEKTALDVPQPKPAPAQPGGRKRGTIVSIHGKDVFVDVPGGRGQGVLSLDQFTEHPPVVGEAVDFEIDHYDAANGLLVLTRDGAAQRVTDWTGISYGMIVEAKVTELNKNKTGMMVEVNGIRGFMPISQADLYRIEKPEEFVGQRLKVMVTEVVPEERNLLVSRRAVMEKERQQKAEQFWQKLAEGQIYKGIVKSIKPFGAFVDLEGAADGLIPIGELSWSRVATVEEVVKVGQLVEVKVIRLDPETRKIGLSLRALAGNPWDDFAKSHRPGSQVKGTVTRVADFGAFVELASGIEGLIHVSEMSTQRVRRPSDVVKEGQQVEVRILALDPESRRIGLSLKAIAQDAEDKADAETAAEDEADKLEAAYRLANRPTNPNLRGGIGGGKPLFDV